MISANTFYGEKSLRDLDGPNRQNSNTNGDIQTSTTAASEQLSHPEGKTAGGAGPVESFEDLSISDEILAGISAMGFERPTQIQKHAIPPLLERCDVLGQAVSGSGKTATFVIAALHAVERAGRGRTSVVIVENTADLAVQVESVAHSIGRMMSPPAQTLVCAGDTRFGDTCRMIRQARPEIVIGTMGRIIRLAKENLLRLSDIELLIIDEGDSLLVNTGESHISQKGLLGQVQIIVNQLGPQCNIGVFSATMTDQTVATVKQFMSNPVVCRMNSTSSTTMPSALMQYRVKDHTVGDRFLQRKMKFDILTHLLSNLGSRGGIVFVNRKTTQEDLTTALRREGFDATWQLSEYRQNPTKVFVATDRYARGIDIQAVCLVINFDVPADIDRYVHRSGRAGRFGRRGLAITLDVNHYDASQLNRIEAECAVRIEELQEYDLPNLQEQLGVECVDLSVPRHELDRTTLQHYRPREKDAVAAEAEAKRNVENRNSLNLLSLLPGGPKKSAPVQPKCSVQISQTSKSRSASQRMTGSEGAKGSSSRGLSESIMKPSEAAEPVVSAEVLQLRAENQQLRQNRDQLRSHLDDAEKRIESLQYVSGDCVLAMRDLKDCQQELEETRCQLAEVISSNNNASLQVQELKAMVANLRSQLRSETSSIAPPSMASQYSVSSVSSAQSSNLSSLADVAWVNPCPPPQVFTAPSPPAVIVPHSMPVPNVPMKMPYTQDQFRPSQQLDGTVTRVEDYGIFVKVTGGACGMVHVRDLNSRTYVQSAKDMFSVGQKVTTWMQGYKEGNKLRLTMISPWD